jgi:hypothetical protein
MFCMCDDSDYCKHQHRSTQQPSQAWHLGVDLFFKSTLVVKTNYEILATYVPPNYRIMKCFQLLDICFQMVD